MNWTPDWTKPALKDLSHLDRRTRERIFKAVERFAKTGHGDVRKVQGTIELALRLGNWRIFFVRIEEERLIRVLRVRPRGSAYNKP